MPLQWVRRSLALTLFVAFACLTKDGLQMRTKMSFRDVRTPHMRRERALEFFV
jgi:hypothetical protein